MLDWNLWILWIDMALSLQILDLILENKEFLNSKLAKKKPDPS